MVSDFNKKGNSEFFNNNPLFKAVGILFILAIIFLIFSDIKIYQKKQDLTSQINAYKKQIADIQKSSKTLKSEIANSDNVDYLEKLAYEQLGEQKPGEKEIIFVTPEDKPKPAARSQNFLDVKLWAGWLSGAWQWIKSKF